jgi:hypothetical protein
MAFEQLVAEAAAKKEKKGDKKKEKTHDHKHGHVATAAGTDSEAAKVAGDVPNVPKA